MATNSQQDHFHSLLCVANVLPILPHPRQNEGHHSLIIVEAEADPLLPNENEQAEVPNQSSVQSNFSQAVRATRKEAIPSPHLPLWSRCLLARMDYPDSIDRTTTNTNHDTSTAVTRRNEITQDTVIEMWKKTVESIGTGTSERETTMTFLRERKGTTVVVALHDEIERETLIANENVIETIIGNQIHYVTDNTGGENNYDYCQCLFFFSLFLFSWNNTIFQLLHLFISNEKES